MKLVCVLVALAGTIYADVYLQNPRGSNNRLNSNGRDRRNAQRLFDSENNARGGYNAGGLQYVVGSVLSIEWTNQHSCSDPNNNCELVLQYMCGENVRNGDTETIIPHPANHKNRECTNLDCNTDFEYGMHEDYEHYQYCYIRERNKGLFTADQDLNRRDTARFTRQDRNGQRHGYECPEERDYYPYWGQSPWRDIAVLTSNTDRCDYYKAESANVKDRYYCKIDLDSLGVDRPDWFHRNPVPITEEACKNYNPEVQLRNGEIVKVQGVWTKLPSHGIPAPDCIKAPRSRDNHNGNGLGGFPNTYNWTIPNDLNENCVLRIRYNISTGDYPWETFSDSNGRNSRNQPCRACAVHLGEQAEIEDKFEGEDRGYILTKNPDVLPMKIDGKIQEKFELKLAVNTAQFGRTFQDRSHVFSIVERPSNIPPTTKIYNLNVRGKRGNIVQTYPATEYDFVPNRLNINTGDAVHIQWTGSDNNPGNNAGQGRAGTDRHNMCLLRDALYEDVQKAKADKPNKYGHWANSYPAHLNNTSLLGFDFKERSLLAFSGANFYGENDQLNEAGTYFNLGPRQITKVGAHRYFCSRNNAFTNRGQKGVIVVKGVGASTFKDSERYDEEDTVMSQLDL